MVSRLSQGQTPPVVTVATLFPGFPGMMLAGLIAMFERSWRPTPQCPQMIGESQLVRGQESWGFVVYDWFYQLMVGHDSHWPFRQPDASGAVRIDTYNPQSLQNRKYIGNVSLAVFPRWELSGSFAKGPGFFMVVISPDHTRITCMMIVGVQILQCRFERDLANNDPCLPGLHFDSLRRHAFNSE